MKKTIIDVNDFVSTSEKSISKVLTKSPLQIAAQELKTNLENCRSVSSYFRELRKNAIDKEGEVSKVRQLLLEYQKKGKKFDAAKLADIINIGNLQPILDADNFLQTKRTKPAQVWSGARMQAAFLRAIAAE